MTYKPNDKKNARWKSTDHGNKTQQSQTRVNELRNWIRREREFVSFLLMQNGNGTRRIERHPRVAKCLTDGI